MTITTTDLIVEAIRLESPLYEYGHRDCSLAMIQSDKWREWNVEYSQATVTLAVAADFDGTHLREAARVQWPAPETRSDEIDPPVGNSLLISAALISEKPPADRLGYIELVMGKTRSGAGTEEVQS